jgi:hypothetical protein
MPVTDRSEQPKHVFQFVMSVALTNRFFNNSSFQRGLFRTTVLIFTSGRLSVLCLAEFLLFISVHVSCPVYAVTSNGLWGKNKLFMIYLTAPSAGYIT